MQRNLDGIYFRVVRDKPCNVCFSDLTDDEMDKVLYGREDEWLKQLCKVLGKRLKRIGDIFEIEIDSKPTL